MNKDLINPKYDKESTIDDITVSLMNRLVDPLDPDYKQKADFIRYNVTLAWVIGDREGYVQAIRDNVSVVEGYGN